MWKRPNSICSNIYLFPYCIYFSFNLNFGRCEWWKSEQGHFYIRPFLCLLTGVTGLMNFVFRKSITCNESLFYTKVRRYRTKVRMNGTTESFKFPSADQQLNPQ